MTTRFMRVAILAAVATLLAAPPVRAQGCSTYLTAADKAALDAIVGKADTVIFGESSHGLTAVHCFVGEVFQHLVQAKGFRVFVFESAWGLEDGFAEFMQSDRTTVTPAESFFLNAFNSAPTLSMLAWIREYNRAHPKDPVRITGFQPEQPVTDYQGIRRYLASTDPAAIPSFEEATGSCKVGGESFKTDLDFIGYSAKRRRTEKLPTYSPEERQQCLAGLDRVRRSFAGHRTAWSKKSGVAAFKEAALHVRSLQNYVGLLSRVIDASVANPNPSEAEALALGHEAYTQGDAARLEVYETLKETRYAGLKTFLWMHDWHAARKSGDLEYAGQIPKGTISIGTRMAEAYKNRLVVIGGIVGCPTCENRPADALDKRFEEAFGNRAGFLDLRKPIPAPLPADLLLSGSLWIQLYKDRVSGLSLRDQFDAVYFLPVSKTIYEK